MNTMIHVEYTAQELQVITQLIDMAVKSGGLQVATAALMLHQKHTQALQAAQNTDKAQDKTIAAEYVVQEE